MRALTLFFAVLILCNTASMADAVTSKPKTHSVAVAHSNVDEKQNINDLTGLTAKSKARTTHTDRVSLAKLAREALALHFGSSKYKDMQELIAATPVYAEYQRPAGLFVTLSRNGKTRACWGSVDPTNQNIVSATVETTENALTKEYRYPRIRESEWSHLKAQVTVVRSIEPISSTSGQNAMQYGMYVRQGSRGAVILPGEMSDAHYQLIKCKLKAGIPVNQPCQIYRIRADVFK